MSNTKKHMREYGIFHFPVAIIRNATHNKRQIVLSRGYLFSIARSSTVAFYKLISYNGGNYGGRKQPELELKVRMLNINKGYNKAIMEQCQSLSEYMQYVDKVRTYAETMPIQEAVEQSVTESICNLMETMKLSLSQAMDALKIPAEDRSMYAARIQRQ